MAPSGTALSPSIRLTGRPEHGRRHREVLQVREGLGAITSDDLPAPGDAWVHFSAIEAPGYRELAAGDVVEFDFEAAQQDSFHFRATSVRRLAPGPAPTLRRRGGEVRIEPADTPDTPLEPRQSC